uniref:U6 snRNA-associated Sm-like protein LSm1 n=1 Tax=Macrostomum lignano TaxID=282301 RepID=A0A1I8GAQ9_9PLAT
RQNQKGPPGPYQQMQTPPNQRYQQQMQQQQQQQQQHMSPAMAVGIGQTAYLAGTATLVQDVDKQVLVVLRDNRILIGWLRSLDQFANLMLHRSVERIYVHGPDSLVRFGDIERGLYLVRGENVLLMGEFDPSYDANLTQVSADEILQLQHQEQEDQKKREERRRRAMIECGLMPTVPDAFDEFGLVLVRSQVRILYNSTL